MKKGICIVFLDKNKMLKFLKQLEETSDIKWVKGEKPTEYMDWYEDNEYTNHISLVIECSDMFYKKPFLTYSVDFRCIKNRAIEGYSMFLIK